MLRKYENNAWQDITQLRRHDGSAWVDCNFARKYENGAWSDVWTPGIKVGQTIDDYVSTPLSGNTPLRPDTNPSAWIGHVKTIPTPGVYTIEFGTFVWWYFTGHLIVDLNAIDVVTGESTYVTTIFNKYSKSTNQNKTTLNNVNPVTRTGVHITTSNSRLQVFAYFGSDGSGIQYSNSKGYPSLRLSNVKLTRTA